MEVKRIVPKRTVRAEKVCRICGSTGSRDNTLQPIFQANESKKSTPLHKTINQYLPINVERNDEFSLEICSSCTNQLTMWDEFYSLCMETDTKFNQARENQLQLLSIQRKQEFEECVVNELTSVSEVRELSVINCEYCGEQFENQSEHTDHIKFEHHDKIFHCEICDNYLDQNLLIMHMTEHALNSVISDENVKNEETVLLETEKTKEKDKQCDLCDKKFSSRNGLRYHKSQIHDQLKNCVCDTCGKSFGSNKLLQNHQTIHSQERNYTCDECHKAFKTDAALYTHRKIHEDSYPFECDVCSKKFKFRYKFNYHMMVHTKEKIHSCHLCDKKFALKHSLTTHLRTHQQSNDFNCRICSFVTSQKRYLAEHMKRSHQSHL